MVHDFFRVATNFDIDFKEVIKCYYSTEPLRHADKKCPFF